MPSGRSVVYSVGSVRAWMCILGLYRVRPVGKHVHGCSTGETAGSAAGISGRKHGCSLLTCSVIELDLVSENGLAFADVQGKRWKLLSCF